MNRLLKIAIWTVLFTLVAACSAAPAQPWQKFTFNGNEDGWADKIDLLAYAYGDKDRMLMDDASARRTLVYSKGEGLIPVESINGPMPVGEFLFVKWRVRSTGLVFEERVDLRHRLPTSMKDHGLTFVIAGEQLYVYVIAPVAKPIGSPPVNRTWRSKRLYTYEIFPQVKKG